MTAFHTVVKGDTLSKISKTYQIPVADLRNINNFGNTNIPKVGEEIALSKEEVLGLQVLFLDRDRNPIKGLAYRVEFAGKSKSGRSAESGLSPKIVTNTPRDVVRILVERPSGSWKEIAAVLSGYGSKLVTLVSPSIRIESKTEQHPAEADGRLPNKKNKPPPLHSPAAEKTPTADKTELGPQVTLVKTPDGLPLGKITGDIPGLDFLGHFTDEQLTEADYAAAAAELGCEVNVIRALEKVESGGSGFDINNRPSILYERHIFSKLTNRIYDNKYPDISAAKGYKLKTRGMPVAPDQLVLHYYPASSEKNYQRLAKAYQLDKEAALKACSWGKFQVLGANYKDVGFNSVRAMVDEHVKGPRGHLKTFVGYIKRRKLQHAMAKKDWAAIAEGYNGKCYKKFKYDERIRDEYYAISK